ncbi:LysR family transcriptional regulator [Paradesulfitobacterium aromaticivorans]
MIVESLRVFVTVVDKKSFSRAADELFISQPSVSLHIRNLENEFNVKLLNRSPKQVEPTESGRILYEQARQILLLYNQAKENIDELRNVVKGNLKIGASFTIGEYVLPRLMAEYATQYPYVEIEVMIANTEEVIQALRANQLHIGLVEGKVTHTDILSEPFMEDEMILVVPPKHPLAGHQEVMAERLHDQVWILREHGSGTRMFSDYLIEEYKLSVKRSFVFSSSQGVKEAVAAGLGIALVSRLIVQRELTSGELIGLRIKGKRITRRFVIIVLPTSASSKALEVFMDKVTSYQWETQ